MSLRVAYLVSRFPKVSETFIVDEVQALERRGAEVDLYAFVRTRESLVQSASRELVGRVRYPGGRRAFWIGAQLLWLVRRPARLLALWLEVLLRHARSPRALLRAVAATAHAAPFALEMERSGVRHLHAHWATHTATCAWAIHRLTGLPYSFTAHADDIFVRRPMLAAKVRDAAFVVTIADFTKRFVLEALGGWASQRLHVVRCGVELERFPASAFPGGARLEIACVARLEPKKGLGRLLEACALLRARNVPLRCRVAGEGRERADLEALRDRLGLGEAVELEGAQPRERVLELVRAAHVVALPAVIDPEGRADGIPVALIEAQALGRPVVGTRVSGIPELVMDGETGILVPPGDVPALADALEALHRDRARAARLGEAGRKRVAEIFDVDRSAADLLALMRDAASVGSADSPRAVSASDGAIALSDVAPSEEAT